MKKRIITLLMAGILVFSTLLTGCGEEKDNQSDTVAEGPRYKTQYHDFALDENEFLMSTSVWQDYLYYLTMTYDEATMTSGTKLYKMSISDWSKTEVPIELHKESYVQDMYVGETGIYLVSMYTQWDEEYTKLLDSSSWIIQLDHDGNEVGTTDVSEELKSRQSEDGYPAYISSVVCDKDGNVYISDSESFILVWDKDGNKIADIPLSSWGNGLVSAEDGSVYYSYMDDMSWDNVLVPVLTEEQRLGDKVGNVAAMNMSEIYIDKNQVAVIAAENELKTYDLTSGEEKVLLNWLDYDINGNDVRMVRTLDDGRIIAYAESYMGDTSTGEIIILEETDEPIEEKTIITYATYGTDSDVSEAIIRFNKNSDEYRIKVVDFYDEEDWEAGMNAYQEAVLNGEAGDIVSVNTEEYKSYARKGLYIDLNEFMDNDPDVNREDYFDNILKAHEVDGKLYAMPTSFNISTLSGKVSVWGEERADMDKFMEVAEGLPDDVYLMEGISKSTWLYVALSAGLDNFINWETGECSFDSPEFIKILETANCFEDEYDYESVAGNTPTLLQSGKAMLYSDNLSRITDYQVTKMLFGEETTNVGYPGAAGNGSIITGYGSLFAITEECESKEGAWEFVKFMISEDYQSQYISWNIPIHKAAFDKQMEDASKKEYYKNEDGEEVEAPIMTYGWDSVTFQIYAATEEEVAKFREIVEGASVMATTDTDITTIIEEEVAPFFDGKKTAEEVATIIQGRVKIYVNEMR